MAIKYWDIQNPVLTFKAMLTGALTSFVLIPSSLFIRWLIEDKLMLGLGLIVGLGAFTFYLFTWAYIARRFLSIDNQ